jgi:hypothetical protein
MTLAASALALWLAAAQVAGAAPALDRSEVTLDHAVAVLETDGEQAPRFVLRSDFVLALRTELRMRNAPDALHVPVDPTMVSEPILEQLSAEVLVVREAERAALGDVDPADIARYRAHVLARIGGDAGLRELLAATGTSPAEFDALVRRRAVAERYLVQRHPRLIEPTVEDLRARFERERRDDPAGTPDSFAAARPVLFERMVRESLPRALRQYLRGLGSRVRVRRLAPAVVIP